MNTGRVVALLKDLEGWRPYPYDDKSPWPRTEVARLDCRFVSGQYKVIATGGTATIGYGETGADFIDQYWGRRITQAEALAKMADRVQGFYQGVLGCIEVDLTEHQWEAVTCRAYQSGAGGFCRSETAALLNDGDVAGALAKWREEFAHPNRSEIEIAHFLTPDEEAPMTRIYTRDEWGAWSPNGRSPAPGMTRGIGVHYLGDGRGPTGGLNDSMAKMREVQAFHMGPSRGWADFAYNWAVDMHGHAFEGRGARVRNAANGGGVRHGYDANAGWSSLLYLNGTGGPDLTEAAKRAINDVAVHAGVAGGEWLGHRDFLSTACPGDQTYEWVHAGHPGGAPEPQPAPEPEDEDMAGLFLFDYVPDGTSTPVAILYTDGRLKWGLESGEQLAFFATGKVPHLGAKGDQFFHELDWHPGGKDSKPDQRLAALAASPDLVEVEGGHYSLAGGITEAMERSDFETGDPGCG